MIHSASFANSPEIHAQTRYDESNTSGKPEDVRNKRTPSRPGNRTANNMNHRGLFSLPPIATPTTTAPTALTLPRKRRITGDKEVDAVLWLREVINTGDAALIARAREAAARIETPLKVLEERYTAHLRDTNPGNPFAGLSSFGFADLDRLAERALQRRSRQIEVMGRFGSVDALFTDQPPEAFCAAALAGLERSLHRALVLDKIEVAERFEACPGEMPTSLSDCLHELGYWEQLYRLRRAFDDIGDPAEEASSREWFVFGLLAKIPPRDRREARAVFAYLYESGRDNQDEARAILANLIG